VKEKEICDLCPIKNRNDMKRRKRRRRSLKQYLP
jgi:hypothetical protein